MSCTRIRRRRRRGGPGAALDHGAVPRGSAPRRPAPRWTGPALWPRRARVRRGRRGPPDRRPIVDGIAERSERRTLELVDLPSESRSEAANYTNWNCRSRCEGAFELADAATPRASSSRRRDGRRCRSSSSRGTRHGAGAREPPGRREADTVTGRGHSDMKGALAVMVDSHRMWRPTDRETSTSGSSSSVARSCRITESACCPSSSAACRSGHRAANDDGADRQPDQSGCSGQPERARRGARPDRSSARPWLGDNAIHAAIASLSTIADRPVRDVEIDGLVYREVVSVTTSRGRRARRT